MAQPDTFKPIQITPLTGPMGTRSDPDVTPGGFWRYRQNMAVRKSGAVDRRFGWRKLLADAVNYNNQDLHDQLCGDPVGTTNLQEYYADRVPPHEDADEEVRVYPPAAEYCGTTPLYRTNGRQPVTHLSSFTSTSGVRRLIAGTQNRLYTLDEGRGTYKIISDAFGGTEIADLPERRWHAAQVNDAVVLTNNFNSPKVWIFDQPTFGCAMQAVRSIPQLDEIGIAAASVVVAWKGVVFFGDVLMDGSRVNHRVVWSDINAPFSWVPGNDSIAGFQDLAFGEKILAMRPLNNFLIIYTDKSVWKVSAIGGDLVYDFDQVYTDPINGNSCLAYRNTLISDGDDHFFLGREGIYRYNLYLSEPERVEWIHASSDVIFDTIDDQRCQAHVSHFNSNTKEWWISWVEDGQEFPTRTMVYNLRYLTSDIVDHGFTAFTSYISDTRDTIRDFILERCICTKTEFDSAPVQAIITSPVKEGGICYEEAVIDCDDVDRNIPIYTHSPMDVDGRFIEDYTKATADSDSLCALLVGLTLDDLCRECNSKQLFVMASATDWCLKEYGTVYYRDRCTDMLDCGTYAQDGYDSILRTSALDFDVPQSEKTLSRIEAEFEAVVQTIPSTIALAVGNSFLAEDPNTASGKCAIVWKTLSSKTLECKSGFTEDEHEAANTRPGNPVRWSMWFSNRYLYLELTITGTGGGSSFSKLMGQVRKEKSSMTR